MHSKQKFKFEVPYAIKLMEDIKNGIDTKEKLKESTGIGENKIVTYLEWLKYINGIKIDNRIISLTKLGETYIEIKYSDDLVEPLMFYHLLRDPSLPENDGHLYFSAIINDVLFENVFSYENTLSTNDIKKSLSKMEINDSEFIIAAINTLADSELGFGKMGILEPEEGENKNQKYEIHSYWVEPLVAAYILYDIWEENQGSMDIEKIISSKYNLGRFFLMDEEAIMETLEEIQNLKLISIEKIAGLNQIRINPEIKKDDILDMIIKMS
ncbi:DUF4007 family protein [Cetobacterium sp. SF1]|uniref:DUF4007 family protein n=1 Tax=Cetobacterium sp. SF1 TaxID=3417654 RepID=UPI003CE94985